MDSNPATLSCVLVCDSGPYGVSLKVQNHRPAHNNGHVDIVNMYINKNDNANHMTTFTIYGEEVHLKCQSR